MNIDIDGDDCIIVETNWSEVGKRSAGSARCRNPAAVCYVEGKVDAFPACNKGRAVR